MGVCSQKMGECLVDHDHVLALRAVVPGKVAPPQSGAHSSQISRSHNVDQWARQIVRLLNSFGQGRSPGAIPPEGKVVRDPGRLDSGNCAYPGEDLLEDGSALLSAGGIVGSTVVVFDFDRSGAIGLKSEVDIEHVHEAPQQ